MFSYQTAASKVQKYDIFDDVLVRKLLSFIDDSEENESIKSCEFAMDFFSSGKIVTSGSFDSFCTDKFTEGIYEASRMDDKLLSSWTNSASGLITSLRVSESSEEFAAGIKNLTSAPSSTMSRKEKTLFLSKFLQNSSLPELENHPIRLKLVENSEHVQNYYSQIRGKASEHKKPSENVTTGTSIPTIYGFSSPQIKNRPKLSKKETRQTITKKPISALADSTSSFKPKQSGSKSVWRVCRFCLKNGEQEEVYSSHFVRSPNGTVTCPILRRYVCELCGATGAYSHTRKYCPLYNATSSVADYKRIAKSLLDVNCNRYERESCMF